MTYRGSDGDTNPGQDKPKQQFPQQQGSYSWESPNSWQDSSQYGGPPPQHPMYNQASAAQSGSRNTGLIVGLVVAIVLLLLAVAGIAAWNFGLFGGRSASGPETTVQLVTETSSESSSESSSEQDSETSESSSARQEATTTFSRSQRSPEPNRPRGSDYTSQYAATAETSDAFARSVGDAFREHVDRTGRTSGTISAYSPVTGLTYTMSCADYGSYVSCAGGNNALVHIS